MKDFLDHAAEYKATLFDALSEEVLNNLKSATLALLEAWNNGHSVYICGNGGSAGNAMHIANDLIYGVGACGKKPSRPGLAVEALCSNTAIITCLANDTGYENIFSSQIIAKGKDKDVLIALSGSGKSRNIVEGLKAAKAKNMVTISIVGFDGGDCKDISDITIHVKAFDMQIAEDTQVVLMHICSQWLMENR